MMVVVPRAFPDKKSSFHTYSVMHESALIYICGWHERFHISYQTDNYKFMHNILDLIFNITYLKPRPNSNCTRLDTFYSDESICLIFVEQKFSWNSFELTFLKPCKSSRPWQDKSQKTKFNFVHDWVISFALGW